MKGLIRPFVHQGRALRRYLARQISTATHAPVGREPEFDPETLAWFRERIGRCKAYLEYGAGGSTMLAADAKIGSISVESDLEYAAAVRDAVAGDGRNLIISVPIGATEDWGYPLWIFPTKAAVGRWREYPVSGVEAIYGLPAFPDLVLIDGRFRCACALAVARAAAATGSATEILFDDYAFRPHYAEVEAVLGEPERIGRAALFRIAPDLIDIARADAMFERAARDFR